VRPLPAALLLALACTACGAAEDEVVTLSLTPDAVQPGGEDYLCYGFDPAPLAGRAITRVTWSPPSKGGVTVHHATAYALLEPFPDGPLSCLLMPDKADGLHIWAPGNDALVMPEGTALAVPAEATKIVVQAHVIRTSEAPAAALGVAFTLAEEAPAHLAAWHSTYADVPQIPPHGEATATGLCRARADVHAVFAWPHMHRLGKRFHGEVVRATGATESIVEVPAWDVDDERIYPVSVDIGAGDVLRIGCAWSNPGDTAVGAGHDMADEMCTQGLITWPADAPRCEPL
jgi:hypothetical protein